MKRTQSVMNVPLQVNRFAESVLLIVQYRYLKSFPEIFILQNLILRTRSCVIGFITQSCWVFSFLSDRICQWEMICIGGVPVSKRSAGPALKYFTLFIEAGGLKVSSK